MAEKLKVGIVGATGMVGQRFVSLLAEHPWFQVTVVAASETLRWKAVRRSGEAAGGPCHADPGGDREAGRQERRKIDGSQAVDFVFCAVDMPKDQTPGARRPVREGRDTRRVQQLGAPVDR